MKKFAICLFLICEHIEASNIIKLPDEIKDTILSSLNPSDLICFGLSSKDAHNFIRQYHQWRSIAVGVYLDNESEFSELIKEQKNSCLSGIFLFEVEDDSWYQISLILNNLKKYNNLSKKKQNLCEKYNLFSIEKALTDYSPLVKRPFYAVNLSAIYLSSSIVFLGCINLFNPIVFFNPILLPLDIAMLYGGCGVFGASAVIWVLFEDGFEMLDKKLLALDRERILLAITAKNPQWFKRIEHLKSWNMNLVFDH